MKQNQVGAVVGKGRDGHDRWNMAAKKGGAHTPKHEKRLQNRSRRDIAERLSERK
jgi:hypothetical protein